MENCIFCNRELDKDDTLYETANFFVKVGIGLAAPGHVMLIPKVHCDCCADMPHALRSEYEDLKKFVYDKIKEAFSPPFLVEYGILRQSVPHAHLHFIPKERAATQYYTEYKIRDLFEDIGVPPEMLVDKATWERAEEMRKIDGGYIYLKDKVSYLFSRFPNNFSSEDLGYRNFFGEKLGAIDIPVTWKNMNEKDKQIDAIKKEITKKLLKF